MSMPSRIASLVSSGEAGTGFVFDHNESVLGMSPDDVGQLKSRGAW